VVFGLYDKEYKAKVTKVNKKTVQVLYYTGEVENVPKENVRSKA
jgi:hypothetical protein